VVVLVIGIVASGSYASVREGHLAVGQSMRLDGYTLTNRGLYLTRGPNFSTEHVRLAVSHNGRSMGTLAPGLRSFTDTGSQVTSNDVDIRTMYPSLTDLYTILQGVDLNGSGGVDLKVLVNPAIGLVWLAGAIFLLGAVVTVWPDPREARMLARRYAAALAREA